MQILSYVTLLVTLRQNDVTSSAMILTLVLLMKGVKAFESENGMLSKPNIEILQRPT